MGNRQQAEQFLHAGTMAVSDSSNPDHLTHAYRCLASACYADPSWHQPFYQTGNVDSDYNLHHSAVAHWRRALECEMTDAERAQVCTNLAWRCFTTGQVDEALEHALYSTQVEHEHVGYSWINLANTYQVLDRPQEAAHAARKAFALKPDDALVEFGLGLALLFNRELEEGFKHLEARFRYKLKSYLQYPYPKWDGTPGQTVYLVADQGLGDTLSFARFVPLLCQRAKYVHAYIQPELTRLFMHAFIGIKNLNITPSGVTLPQAEAWTTFVGLPDALKLDAQTIRTMPQIDCPVMSMPDSWKVPDRKLHIGICWTGSPLNDLNVHRSIPLEQFLELYRVPGIQLYSLQVGPNAKDLHDKLCSAIIQDLTPYCRDVVDTVSLLRGLDLVIGCESALGHICSSVGKEFWLPYSFLGRDYRVGLTGKDRLWTPKHEIFRQGRDRRWEPVFENIQWILRERINELDRAA